MAIDTQNKRRSVQAYTFGLMRLVADGVVGTADRPTSAWLYSGLTYGASGVVVEPDHFVGFHVNMGSMMVRR